jgi:branched-chain amino acid transport system permease protein
MQALVILGGVLFGALGGIVFIRSRSSVQPDSLGRHRHVLHLDDPAPRRRRDASSGPVLGSCCSGALLDPFVKRVAARPIVQGDVIRGHPRTQVEPGPGWLMLLMIFRPQGILGDRKELALDAR